MVDKSKYVVLDVETNGLSSKKDDLLSISIYKPDTGEIYERYLPLELNDYVKTTRINGISENLLSDETPITQEELNRIFQVFELKHRTILTFGDLDRRFIREYLRRHNLAGFQLLRFTDIRESIISPIHCNFSITKDAICSALKIGPISPTHSGTRDCLLEWRLFETMAGRRLAINADGKMHFIEEDYLIPASWTYSKTKAVPKGSPLNTLRVHETEVLRCQANLYPDLFFPSEFGCSFEHRLAIALGATQTDSSATILANSEKLTFAGRLCAPEATLASAVCIIEADGSIRIENGTKQDNLLIGRMNDSLSAAFDEMHGIIDYLKTSVFRSQPVRSQELVLDHSRGYLARCDFSNNNAIVEVKTGKRFKPSDAKYQLFLESKGRPAYILWIDCGSVILSRVSFSFDDSEKKTDYELVQKISKWRSGLEGTPRGAMAECARRTGIDYQKVRSLWNEANPDNSVFEHCDQTTPIGFVNEFDESSLYSKRRTKRSRELFFQGFETKGKTLLAYTSFEEHVSIPPDIKAIAPNAFSGNGWIKSVIIPEGVDCIPSGAFKNCWSLSEVTIPASVVTIGEEAFNGCWSLKNVHFAKDSRLEKICGYVRNGYELFSTLEDHSCFSHCPLESPLPLPDSVASLDEYAFFRCGDLRLLYDGETYSPKELSEKLKNTSMEQRRDTFREYYALIAQNRSLSESFEAIRKVFKQKDISMKGTPLSEMRVGDTTVYSDCSVGLKWGYDAVLPDKCNLVNESGKVIVSVSRRRIYWLYDFLMANSDETFSSVEISKIEEDNQTTFAIEIQK